MTHNLFAPEPARPWRPRTQLAPHSSAPQSNIAAQYYISPEWAQLRAAMMAALQDFPEAAQSLTRALQTHRVFPDSHAPTP